MIRQPPLIAADIAAAAAASAAIADSATIIEISCEARHYAIAFIATFIAILLLTFILFSFAPC